MPTELQNSTTRAQHEACREAIRRGLSVVRIAAPMSLSRWADEHYRLSEETDIPQDWETIPLQRGIMDLMSCEDVDFLDFKKCARIGYTKMLNAFVGYQVVHHKRSGAVFQPTQGDSDEYCEDEIDPMIRDVPVVRDALLADPSKQGRNNKLSFKKFAGANLYLRGGHAARSYRRITLAWVCYDELEGFEREIGKEGRAVKLGDGRISNSPFMKSIRGSTPGEELDSLLKDEVDKAAIVLKFWIHCIHCDEAQTLKWSRMRWNKEGSIDERAKSARYECEHCSRDMIHADIWEMSERGYWGTDDEDREQQLYMECTDADPVLREVGTDKAVDWPRHVAVDTWVAYSPFFSWSKLVYEWLEAQGDYLALKTFTNIRLGEFWVEETEVVEHHVLFERREAYVRPPNGVLVIVAGVDVQATWIELEIFGVGYHEETWGIETRKIYGDPEMPQVWRDLDAALLQAFETEDGRKLRVSAVGLDTGYLPDHCYAFAERSQHPRIYCLKGSSDYGAPLIGAPSKQKVPNKPGKTVDLFSIGVSVGKSILYKRLALKEKGPGYAHFPQSYDEEYFLGLTAEKKVVKKKKGFETVEWIKEYERNEPLDCRNYGMAALTILNPIYSALDPESKPEKRADQPRQPSLEERFRRQRRSQRRANRRGGFATRR